MENVNLKLSEIAKGDLKGLPRKKTKRDLEIELDVMTNRYNETMKRALEAEKKLAQFTKYGVVELNSEHPTVASYTNMFIDEREAGVCDTREQANAVADRWFSIDRQFCVKKLYAVAEIFNERYTGK